MNIDQKISPKGNATIEKRQGPSLKIHPAIFIVFQRIVYFHRIKIQLLKKKL